MAYKSLACLGLVLLFASSGCTTSTPSPTCGFFNFSPKTDKDQNGNVAAQFKLDFTFHPSQCNSTCSCDKVWFVQILRVLDLDNPSSIMQTSDEQQARMVQSTDLSLKGWAVDRIAGSKFGYYHMNSSGGLDQDPFDLWQFGYVDTPAIMHDSVQPGANWRWGSNVKRVQYQGIAAAVCIDGGSCQAHVLGMKQWVTNYDRTTNTIDPPTAYDTFTWAQGALTAAVSAWNNQGGHDALPTFTFNP